MVNADYRCGDCGRLLGIAGTCGVCHTTRQERERLQDEADRQLANHNMATHLADWCWLLGLFVLGGLLVWLVQWWAGR